VDAELGLREKRAWVSFFIAHGLLTRLIDERLRQAGMVSMDVYDVLITLEESPGMRLRMSELADRVLLTRSGITRMIDRLESAGLIERQASSQDRRAMHAVLTEKGLGERERAWPVYEQAIQELFASKLEPSDTETFLKVFSKIIGDRPYALFSPYEPPE
jgi:DNA-binding MarR family transcriptional regulator